MKMGEIFENLSAYDGRKITLIFIGLVDNKKPSQID